MSRRRVVITGMDMLLPLGLDVPSSWEDILAGHNGIAPIEHMDLSTYSTRFGGSAKGFNVGEYLSAEEARKFDPFIQYGLTASFQAVRDPGLEVTDANRERIGVSMGSGVGGLTNIENNCWSLSEQGPRCVSPFSVSGPIINMVSGFLLIHLGLQGPNHALTTACATGTYNIDMTAHNITYGGADVMVAGGSEMTVYGLGLGGFGTARALSTRNDEPTHTSHSWDRDRDGFVLFDGSGVLVLEELEHARTRGARTYAELAGLGMSSDAFHMIAPPENGVGAVRCMKNALCDAGLDPRQVNYINTHGTSAPVSGITEITAAKSVLGEHVHTLLMSSTKSMTGHLLGAAGVVETIFSVLALRNQVALPAINLDNPDEGCDPNLVARRTKPRKIGVILSNSSGFGGTDSTLVLRRFAD